MTIQLETNAVRRPGIEAEHPVASRQVLGMRIDATTYDDASSLIVGWAMAGESRYLCAATVHMVMEAFDREEYREMVNGADLVVTDGVPLVWALRAMGIRPQKRVYGPDLTLVVLAEAARLGIPVGFLGGRPEVLERLIEVAKARFEGLRVVYAESPPFRPVTKAEDEAAIAAINASGARILFVGLGCPKQETWMAAKLGRVQSVMLGVGAAFDFIAGTTPQAPRWVMNCGLEWLFRLVMEPRRLWKRYLKQNPRFVAHFLLQRLRSALAGVPYRQRRSKREV